MARTPKKTDDEKLNDAQATVRDVILNEKKVAPEASVQGGDDDERPAVKDLPPANPLGEPIEGVYSEGKYAEVNQATLKPSETVVEFPLSPTDSNPNPHGQRSQPMATTMEKDDNGVDHRKMAEEDVEVTGLVPAGVHVGDGRVIAHNEKMKVSKDQAKALRETKQVR